MLEVGYGKFYARLRFYAIVHDYSRGVLRDTGWPLNMQGGWDDAWQGCLILFFGDQLESWRCNEKKLLWPEGLLKIVPIAFREET